MSKISLLRAEVAMAMTSLAKLTGVHDGKFSKLNSNNQVLVWWCMCGCITLEML